MEGWIKLHRNLLKWEWYDDINCSRLFVHLLLTANHAPRKWRKIVIERGQILTSRAKLKQEIGLSDRQIRTCLERLQTTSEVTIQSTNVNSIITICNYDTYQSTADTNDQPNDQQRVTQTTSKRPTITQEGKEDKKKETKGAVVVTYPPVLDCDEFRLKWEEWTSYRKDMKFKTLIPASVKKQFDKCAEWGLEESLAAIDDSIAKGYQGLFKPRQGRNGKSKISTAELFGITEKAI